MQYSPSGATIYIDYLTIIYFADYTADYTP